MKPRGRDSSQRFAKERPTTLRTTAQRESAGATHRLRQLLGDLLRLSSKYLEIGGCSSEVSWRIRSSHQT
jgi:hypothetical protein